MLFGMETSLSRMEAERRRFRAAALLDQGLSQAEVARQVGASPGAVSQWAKARRDGGDAALQAKPHPGPTPKLNDQQMTQLKDLLLQGPLEHGWPNELWTLSRVALLIQKHFGATYDPSGVWHVLNRMGWSCQKPESRARERDEDAIAQWRKSDWPRIKKSPAKRA